MKIKKYRLEDYDFEDLGRKEQVPATRVRLLGLQLLKEGKQKKEIGEVLKKDRHTVANWLTIFLQEGIEGLFDKQRSGRTPILPQDKEEEFLKALDELQSSNTGGRATAKDIQKLLKNKFKVKYSVDGVYDLLDRLNIVWITGRSIHPKADKEAQEEFKKKLSSPLKKMLARKYSSRQSRYMVAR